MRLKIVMLSVIGTTGVAMGQTTPAPRAGGNGGPSAAPERRTTAGGLSGASGVAEAGNARADAAALLGKNGNSLLKASLAARPDTGQAQLKDLSYFAVAVPEPKVIKKHDLVTIIVREESQITTEGSSEVKRESKLDAAIDDFIKLRLSNLELEGGGIGTTPPRISMSGNRSSKDEGTVDRSDRFTARITAEVIDVKPNGTLVLQARKRIKTDDDEQIFALSGTCRAEDITADNSILSTALHDQELTKTHKGTVRNATRRGWGGKLLDVISPF